MNPRLDAFLTRVDQSWQDKTPEEKELLLREYSDPYKLEKHLFELSPDLYAHEAQNPGSVRAMAGELTGGTGVIDAASSIPRQLAGSVMEGVGGVINLAGSTLGYSLPGLSELGKAVRVESTPAYGSEAGQFAGSLAQSIAQNVAAVGAGAVAAPALGLNPVTSVPVIALGLQSALKGGQNISESLEKRPGELLGAGMYGLGGTVTEAAWELMPLGALSRVLKSGGAARDLLEYGAKEGLSEMGTEASDIALETAANVGYKPEQMLGDPYSKSVPRVLKAGLAGVLAAGPTGFIAGRYISPNIQAAQARYEARQAAQDTVTIDEAINNGEAEVVNPFDEEITPTPEQLDEILLRGMEGAEKTQRADIEDLMDIIDELQDKGSPEALDEAQAYADMLYEKYDPLYIETALNERQAQRATEIDEMTGEIEQQKQQLQGQQQQEMQQSMFFSQQELQQPPVEPVEPAEPAEPAEPVIVDMTLKRQAYAAITNYLKAKAGDEKAIEYFSALPDNIKRVVPALAKHVENGTVPGPKVARMLVGKPIKNIEFGPIPKMSTTRRSNKRLYEQAAKNSQRVDEPIDLENDSDFTMATGMPPAEKTRGRDVRIITPEQKKLEDRARYKQFREEAKARVQAARDKEGVARNAIKVGDKITLKNARYLVRPKKDSEVLNLNSISDVTLLEITPEGAYRVSIPVEDGTVEAVVAPESVMPRAQEGITNMGVRPGPVAPDLHSMVMASKQIFTDLKGWLKITMRTPEGKKAFADVKLTLAPDGKGRVVRMRLDYALQNIRYLADKTFAHELGHIVSMIADATSIPGMDKYRPKAGTLLGDLVGEWYPMAKAVMVEPFELKQGVNTQALYDQQAAFEESIYKRYGDKPIDFAALKEMQQHWSNLVLAEVKKQGLKNFMTEEDEVAIRERVKELRKTVGGGYGMEDTHREQAMREVLDKKGLIPGYYIRKEVESVSMKMRGVADTAAGRLAAKRISAKELYADFFSAKLLDLQMQDPTGRWVNMAGYLAPAASRLFDNYMSRKPATRDLFQKLRAARTDSEAVRKEVEEVHRRTIEAEKKALERFQAEHPDMAFLADDAWKSLVWRGAQQLVDTNLPLYWQIKNTLGQKAQDDMREAMEQLRGVSSVASPFMNETSDLFDKAFQELRKTAPDKADAAIELFNEYMMYKRIAEGGRKAKTAQRIRDINGEWIDINREFDLFSGNYGNQENAERVLATHPLFSDPRISSIFNKAIEDFHEIYTRGVIDRWENSQLITKEQADGLRDNIYYATYAIEREMLEQVSFKAVSPAIKAQTGTLNDPKAALAATIEKGVNIIFQSKLNEAKLKMLQYLGEEYKKEVQKSGSMFPMPPDSANWSLITVKKNGEDFGYHVPKILAAGLDYTENNYLQNQFIRSISESSPYFRNLYTTWNPSFAGKNVFRDLFRLIVRSIDPQNKLGLGLGVLPEYARVILDLVSSRWSPEAQGRLDAEEQELYRRAIILSSYDWQARDARDTDSYANLMRQYLLVWRSTDENLIQEQTKAARLIGKMWGGQKINTAVNWWTSGMEAFGRTMEKVPKRAAFRHLSKNARFLSEPELNQMARKSGSPYFLNHGEAHPLTSHLLLFFNPAVQGMYEDAALMKQRPVVAAKWALATAMKLGFHMGLAQGLTILGAFGDEMRRAMLGIPEDDLDRMICIPIGIDGNGKTIYFKFPVDESTALFSRMTRRLSEGHFVKSLLSPAEAVLPNPHPLLETAWVGMSIGLDHNPVTFTGRNRVPQREWEAGAKYPGYRWKPFLQHIYNTVAPITVLYRFPSVSSADDGHGKPTNELVEVISTLAEWPLAQSLLKSVIGVSNQGIIQNKEKILGDLNATQAHMSILADNAALAMVRKDEKAFKKIMLEIAQIGQESPANAVAMMSSLESCDEKTKAIIANGTFDRFMVEFMESSKAEQIELLRQMWPRVLKGANNE